MTDDPQTYGKEVDIRHASCVALNGRGCLILGASGSGKSSLALSLMALGAMLVSDDRVALHRTPSAVIASAPPQLGGLVEARGVGLLRCEFLGQVAVDVVVDMNRAETARYPDQRCIDVLGLDLPLLYRVDAPHFAPALAQFLRCGRHED
ncbi:HPr kinase/phosphatase C-terminal domain-containing protein [Rhodobacteraceae bacterium F11138]|nr:HPr kinase/phosphatase C-terminal domain-containing protein [Rhodobacteraceae bacterium F11138]